MSKRAEKNSDDHDELLELFQKLKPLTEKNPCRTCECLQGALMQLSMDGDEKLAALVEKRRVSAALMHGCLGCEPCPPADFWNDFLKKHKTN